MIFGSHVIVYSQDAPADRDFFRDVLGFSSVNAGSGWLIFALPPAEVAVHPSEGAVSANLYFMCDDLQAEMRALAAKGVTCSQEPGAGPRPPRAEAASAPHRVDPHARLLCS
jgi:catechol 2,3-dioxygenase-like lactoylglutathione lyase family enzyme